MMRRFLVKATCETPLRLTGAVTINFNDTVIHLCDWRVQDPAGPLHLGVFLDLVVNAKDQREAAYLSQRLGDYVATLMAFTMTVAIGPVTPFIVYDYEPEQKDRQVLQQLQLRIARPTRRFDRDSFQALWDAIAQSPDDRRERIIRSIAWYRKTVFERYLLDQFLAMWNGLEVVNPVLKEKYHLPREQTLRSCPKCGTTVINIPTGAGIKFVLDRTGDKTLWKASRDRRVEIFHGARPISEVVKDIERLVSGGVEGLRSGILDMAGVPEAKWVGFKRSPMAIPRPARIRMEYELLDAAFEQVPLGMTFPHLEVVSIEAVREWKGDIQNETASPNLKLLNYSGHWRPLHIAMEADKDPDDQEGKIEIKT